MEKNEIKIYNEKLGLDGTINELLDWAYRYSDDYSDEALDEIARYAGEWNIPEDKAKIPVLVKESRQREKKDDETLPYESMKLDKIIYGQIGFESTEPYGEVEIREEGSKVLVAITGTDDNGCFTAASACSVDEFMNGEENWLESFIGSILFYSKIYEEE